MPIIIAFAILFAIIGGGLADEEGFITGLIAGVSLGIYRVLGSRIDGLKKELDMLRQRVASNEKAAATDQVTVQVASQQQPLSSLNPVVQPEPVRQDKPDASITESLPQAESQPVTATSTPVYEATAAADQVTDLPPHKQDIFDIALDKIKSFFTDGNVVVRVGIIVLFFGVAFLLKFAAEHNMLSIELRLAGVSIGCIVMLVVGWRLRARRRTYALLIQGGAVGVLYLTIFAAAKLYHLLPMVMAFALMLAVVAFSAALAIIQNARALAMFGTAGGFLAPILMSTGSGSHVMLFSYYALLNAGILLIAWYKAWRILNLLGFGFTFVIGALWGANLYRAEYFSTTEPFLILFFLFFVAIAILFAHRQPPELKGYVDGTLVFGVPIVGFTLQAALVKDIEYGLAFSALLMGGFYISLARWLWNKSIDGMRMLTEAFLAIGVVLSSLAIPLALDGQWTGVAWSLEGAAIIWVGIRQSRRLARAFGVLLQILSGLFFVSDAVYSPNSFAIINGVYLGSLTLAIAAIFSGWYLYTHRKLLQEYEQVAIPVLFAWGMLWWLGGGLHEVSEFVPKKILGYSLMTFITATGLFTYWFDRRFQWPLMRYPQLALIPVFLLVTFFLAVINIKGFSVSTVMHPFYNYGYLFWPVCLGIFYYLLRRQGDFFDPAMRFLQHALSYWLVLFLVTWEIAWQVSTTLNISGAWSYMIWGILPALGLMLITSHIDKLCWPFSEHRDRYLGSIQLPVTGWLLFWGVISSLWYRGETAPLPYITLFNPLELAIAFCLLVILKWLLAVRQVSVFILDEFSYKQRLIPLALAAFCWLNGMIIRSVHYYADVPMKLRSMFSSLVYQAAISVTWTLLAMALTVLASRRGNRYLWFTGTGLLAIVVAKLFIIDLVNSGTVERIVSFIVVGVLMLILGYLSPLPPRREETKV